MSEFDKEAEREKLREKFAKDDEKRQSTKRMSELLLKGATMTNSHCNTCGDPIFRFDGQEFCPSCQGAEVSGGQIRLRNPSGQQAAQTQADASEQEATAASETQQTQQTQQTPQTPQARDGEEDVAVEPTQPPVPTEESTEQSTASGKTSPETRAAASPASPTDSPTSGADLDVARAALRRTVTRYAEEAERTDDPRRARELLAAAREAAETLAALRR